MGDAELFRKVMTAKGATPGEPSLALLSFLQGRGVSDSAIEHLRGYVLSGSDGVNAVDIYAEDGWLGANATDYVPIALRDGLLIVGGCPNGDLVVVDVREQLGAAGYVAHDSMWGRPSVRDVFLAVSPGLGAFVAGLDADTLPLDYYEAKGRAGKQG